MSVNFDFKRSPKQAQDYLKNKGFALTFDYDEMIGQAHDKAFSVAKVTRVDLLNDIFTSLNNAMANGQRFEDWRDELKSTLQKKGWWGEKEITDPKTGVTKTVYIGSRRLRTIFKTNQRVAYAHQRYNQQIGLTKAVFWRYRSMLLPNTRDKHAVAHGTILHRDDPFWGVNYPPNGWGCQCSVSALSQKQLDRKGLKVAKQAPATLAEKEWRHSPQTPKKIGTLSKLNILGGALAVLKPNAQLDALSESQLKQRFYDTLGIQAGDQFIDKVGDPMIIDDTLFTTAKGTSKLKKRDRHLYIDELAKTLSDPDEIFIEVENRTGKSKLIKKMFRYFEDENGEKKALMGLFTFESDKTIGTTLYLIDRVGVVDEKRIEKLIYKKEE